MGDGFDLTQTSCTSGSASTATPLPDFTWSPESMAAHDARFASDGNEGRLVCVPPQDATWDSWERHPAGEEVVFLLSGRVDVVQEIDGVRTRHGAAAGPGVGQPAERVAHRAGTRARAGVVHHPGQRDGGPGRS